MIERRLYSGECECPRCGCGSDDLVPDSLPVIVAKLGKTLRLHCQTCHYEWTAVETAAGGTA
jgi:hypothetical protein